MTPRIAIIGCGAVTELFHLPTLAAADALQSAVLVDPAVGRARQLAAKFGVPGVAADFRQVLPEVGAVLIATPHPTHAAVAVACLEAGKHVLCEKPLCVTAAECDTLCAAAARTGRILAVGLIRRQAPAYCEVARLLREGRFGRPLRFDFREGDAFGWPVSSPAFWRREDAGGGTLLDTGPHTLDLLTWWLGDWASVDYEDDNLGNIEANCRLRLTMRNGATGGVELSRTHNPGPWYRIECEGGWIEAAPNDFMRVRTWRAGDNLYEERLLSPAIPARGDEPVPADYPSLFHAQWAAFAARLRGEDANLVEASQCAPAIRLIEACYRGRRTMEMPWLKTEAAP